MNRHRGTEFVEVSAPKTDRMKHLFTLFLFFTILTPGFAQIGGIPMADPGIFQVGSAATNIFRGLKQAHDIQHQRRFGEEYTQLIADADTLFDRGEFESARHLYNQAVIMDSAQQYPKVRLEQIDAVFARRNGDPYQLTVDAGDSLFRQMYYAEAVARYNEALAIKEAPYPRERIAAANHELTRWQTVHFCGLPLTDEYVESVTSRAYANDAFSDFILPGEYPWLGRLLASSHFQTLDGIAVPAGMRLIVYSDHNFRGTVLLDVTGPAIVNNTVRQGALPTIVIPSARLQEAFPPETRTWSQSDMQTWPNGSAQIIAVAPQGE